MKGEGGLNFFGSNIFTRSNELCDSSSKFLEQTSFEQKVCLLLGAISKRLYLSLTTGTNRTDTEKGNMETDFVHPDTEQGAKPNSEDSSVVSDHSDNNNSEEVQGIKCTNLHSRLSGNSRKQKCPMRRYSGSGKISEIYL